MSLGPPEMQARIMRSFAVALVHFPVLARDRSVVTTAITNLDIHDIARSAFTYGALRYYLVHPVLAQRELADRVVAHWTSGSGALRIPDRKPPMESVRVVPSLAAAKADLAETLGATGPGEAVGVESWVTSAAPLPGCITHVAARAQLRQEGPPVLLVLGTGWGLAPQVIENAAVRLEPILSPRSDGYNHLSVRAAAAIFLDRLVGVDNGSLLGASDGSG